MKKFLSLLVAASLALTACGDQKKEKPATGKPVLKIGVMLSLTGDAAQVSNDAKNAILIMNKAYQDKALKTELVIEDTSGDSKKVISVINKLIYIDKVDVIITTISSDAILVSPLAYKNDILHFGIVENANKEKNKTTFTHWTTPQKKVEKLISLLKKDKAKKIAVIVQNTETYKTLSDELSKQAAVNDIKADTYFFNSNNKNYQIELLKIKEKNYHKLVLLMFSPMIDIVGKQLTDLDINTPITSINSFMYSGNNKMFEGIPFVNAYTSKDEDILTLKEEVQAVSTHGFTQFWDILKITSDIANNFYIVHQRKPTGKEMTKIILDMKEYDGKTGHFIFEKNRTIQSEASILKIKNGKPVVIDKF